MKQLSILIATACALAHSLTTRAQTPAAPVAAATAVGADPALAALTAKYEVDVTALKKAQEAALIALRAPYLTSISGAEQKATTIGDTAVLKALLEEKQAVNAGGTLLATPSAALPHTLTAARTTYLREVARVAQTLPPREKALQSAYLRDLGALEQRAKLGKNMAIVTQIGQEKMKLIGQTPKESFSSTAQLERWLTTGNRKWLWKKTADEKGGGPVEFLANKTLMFPSGDGTPKWDIIDLHTIKFSGYGISENSTLKFDEGYTKFTVNDWYGMKRWGELVK